MNLRFVECWPAPRTRFPSNFKKFDSMKITMYRLIVSLLVLTIIGFVGCSSNTGPILPQGELTPEQIEKVKQEDRNIESEESQGSSKK